MKKNILILGHYYKIWSMCRYLASKGYCVYVIQRHMQDAEDWIPKIVLWDIQHDNDPQDKKHLEYFHMVQIAKLNLLRFIDRSLSTIVLDKIINFTEHEYWLEFEHKLIDKFNLNNGMSEDVRKFCYTKSIQDLTWKRLGIPTIPDNSNKVIVKFDGQGGGESFFVVDDNKNNAIDYSKLNEDGKYLTLASEWSNFVIQDYVDIDYQISCHFYCNNNTWYHLNTHVMYYEDNCPVESTTSYVMQDADNKIINNSIKKLSKELSIPNRLVGWQFVKTKDGKLYSTDFNARPFGGYDAGSYDTDVSDQNWIDYLMGETPPETIKYTHEITCKYIDKQQFGYSGFKRFKNKLDLKYEVTKYD